MRKERFETIVMVSQIKTHPLLKILRGVLVDLPTPANISY